jgi:hypothetical protein
MFSNKFPQERFDTYGGKTVPWFRCGPCHLVLQSTGRYMGDTPAFDGCHSHCERRTGTIPGTREFGWDSDLDEVCLGAGVPIVYTTHVFLDMHVVIAQLSSLALRGGGQRVVISASSRV